jgi:dTDP-4-amino-4,6-dideoxygalactose transaminase
MVQKIDHWLKYFYKLPWCVPQWGWAELRATLHCIFSFQIVEGSYILRLENAVKNYLDLSYAISVNRGRTAIEIALRAFELKENDEVILPSYICQSVPEAVVRAGARVVFADVGQDLNLTLESIRAVITPKTKCIIVAHLFGKAAPIDEIEKLAKSANIYLIDDAAQSFGGRLGAKLLGTFGDCGIISCGPGKALAGSGGGLLVTNNSSLYERALKTELEPDHAIHVLKRVISFWIWRRLRRYTLPINIIIERIFRSIKKYHSENMYKMANLEAAIALKQVYSLENHAKQRKENGQQIIQALGKLEQYTISDFSSESMFVKLILVFPTEEISPNALIENFAKAGVECQGGYIPCHHIYNTNLSLSYTDRVWKQVICIPVDSKVTKTICSAIERAMLTIKHAN